MRVPSRCSPLRTHRKPVDARCRHDSRKPIEAHRTRLERSCGLLACHGVGCSMCFLRNRRLLPFPKTLARYRPVISAPQLARFIRPDLRMSLPGKPGRQHPTCHPSPEPIHIHRGKGYLGTAYQIPGRVARQTSIHVSRNRIPQRLDTQPSTPSCFTSSKQQYRQSTASSSPQPSG